MEKDLEGKLLLHSGDQSQLNINREETDHSLCQKVWIESKKLWIVAGPAIFTRISMFGIFAISQAFIGHIGDTEMAAFSLVFHIIVRFSVGLLMGMSSGLETLCGQAFGAKQYHMLGIYLQRSCFVEFGFSLILVPVFTFSSPILKFLGQTDEISEMANTISLWYIPIMYSYLFSFTLQMFLQAQSKNMIITWLAAISLISHGLLSWILVKEYRLGLPGAMISMIVSSWIPIIGQFIFIFLGGCPKTWTGFSSHAFHDLWPIVKLSVSSGVMLCVEIWYNSFLVLLTGSMKEAEVSINSLSQSGYLNVSGWELMLSFGFLAAACVRVSNELGRGSAKAAKFSILVVVSTSLGFGILLWALVLSYRHKFSYIFSASTEVADAVSELSILLAFNLLLNSVQPVLSGVAVGAGWQGKVAYVNIICYYLVGLPFGILLGYVADLGVKGIWIGMIGGTAVQTLVLIYFTYKTDWDKQVSKAQARVNQWVIPTQHEPGSDINQA